MTNLRIKFVFAGPLLHSPSRWHFLFAPFSARKKRCHYIHFRAPALSVWPAEVRVQGILSKFILVKYLQDNLNTIGKTKLNETEIRL